jgi:hypothetical protein
LLDHAFQITPFHTVRIDVCTVRNGSKFLDRHARHRRRSGSLLLLRHGDWSWSLLLWRRTTTLLLLWWPTTTLLLL